MIIDFKIPPQENKPAKIIITQPTRHRVMMCYRAATINVLDRLSHGLQDAHREIAMVRRFYDQTGGYRTSSYDRVRGANRDDVSNYIIDIKNRYERWLNFMRDDQSTISVVRMFCQDDLSLNQIKKYHRISAEKAFKVLKNGLNHYAILAGWGDQK